MSDNNTKDQITSEAIDKKEATEEIKELVKPEEEAIPLKIKLFTVENQTKSKT
jgi:hypothetical protein